MSKTLKNGLGMIETNPLNHNWLDFAILLGLTLHQFQKKLLLSTYFLSTFKGFKLYCCTTQFTLISRLSKIQKEISQYFLLSSIITQYDNSDLSKSQNLDLRLAQNERQFHNDSKSAQPKNYKLISICYVTVFVEFQNLVILDPLYGIHI